MKIYLTIDIEPDYARTDRFDILDNSQRFVQWVKDNGVPLTAFIVGRLFDLGHNIIDELLDAGVPLGLHGYTHQEETFGNMYTSHQVEIYNAVVAFKKRTGEMPKAYRAPLGIISKSDILLLDKLNFIYDASIFPMRRKWRYDYSKLSEQPFMWEGTNIVEIPFGILCTGVPAGMTFINILGERISRFFIKRKIKGLETFVVDLHLHNLFANFDVLKTLPLPLRIVYGYGNLFGGFELLQKLYVKASNSGVRFGNLHVDAAILRNSEIERFDPALLEQGKLLRVSR